MNQATKKNLGKIYNSHTPARRYQSMTKTNNKQKPPNTLLSSQTTRPARNPRAGQPYQRTSVEDRGQLAVYHPETGATVGSRPLLYALDLSTQSLEDLDEQRVAAIDVENVVDLGLPVGYKAGQHQSSAGADI